MLAVEEVGSRKRAAGTGKEEGELATEGRHSSLYAFLKCKWADAVATNSHTKALETMLPWPRDCLGNSMHIQAHHCLGIAEEQHFETLVKMLQVLTAWTKAEGGA